MSRNVNITFIDNGQRRTFGSNKEVLSDKFGKLRDWFQNNDTIEFKQGACLVEIIRLILDVDGFRRINMDELSVGDCLNYLCAANYLRGDTTPFSNKLNDLLSRSPDPIAELLPYNNVIKYLHRQGLRVRSFF